MRQVFDGTIFVHYGFVFLSPAGGSNAALEESRRGQSNGLLGTAVPGVLSLLTGTHTGDVPIRIEWNETEPLIAAHWEDVVEASLDITATDMQLAAFDDFREVTMPLSGPHRVRLCASGIDAARDEDVVEDDQPVGDRYLLQLWPGPARPDHILRVGSSAAQCWHDHAHELSSVPEGRSAHEQTARRVESEYLGWTPPLGRGLSDEEMLADIPLRVRVEMIAPLAAMACAAVDIYDLTPIRSALGALERHEALPAAMTSVAEVMNRLNPQLQLTPQSRRGLDSRIEAAVRAVFAAAEPESALNPAKLFDLVKIATGVRGSGEAIIWQVCMDLGYE